LKNLLFCLGNATVEQPVQEMVEFTIIYSKQKYEVKFALDETVDALKNHIEKLTGNYSLIVLCFINPVVFYSLATIY